MLSPQSVDEGGGCVSHLKTFRDVTKNYLLEYAI